MYQEKRTRIGNVNVQCKKLLKIAGWKKDKRERVEVYTGEGLTRKNQRHCGN